MRTLSSSSLSSLIEVVTGSLLSSVVLIANTLKWSKVQNHLNFNKTHARSPDLSMMLCERSVRHRCMRMSKIITFNHHTPNQLSCNASWCVEIMDECGGSTENDQCTATKQPFRTGLTREVNSVAIPAARFPLQNVIFSLVKCMTHDLRLREVTLRKVDSFP